jgi:hypothetical protein
MSHWIDTPTLVVAANQSPLWQPSDSAWSLVSAAWNGDQVRMQLRHYPDAQALILGVLFDCRTLRASIAQSPDERHSRQGFSEVAVPELDLALQAELRARVSK